MDSVFLISGHITTLSMGLMFHSTIIYEAPTIGQALDLDLGGYNGEKKHTVPALLVLTIKQRKQSH